MWSLMWFCLLVASAGHVHGIELSLTGVNENDMCGKVRCVEDTTYNGDSIKSLKLRKQLATDVLLVEMSQQEPSFTSKKDDRYTKGIWALGTLSSHRAEVQISLYNSEDCNNAEFICEIVHLNKLGVERVTSSSGRISGKLGPQIQEWSSSVNKVLSKLDTLTDTINEVVKKQQQLTICPRGASGSLENRYQVVYSPDGSSSYLCDTYGGWIVIQRRFNGETDFERNWYNYTHGFGSFDGDFWLGLEKIHKSTYTSNKELMITMEYKGYSYHAHYDTFKLLGEEDNYRLSIRGYTGDAGDSLQYHNNMPFSTFDKDNDRDGRNCAERYKGGWWFDTCAYSNLNGKWGAKTDTYPALWWHALAGYNTLARTEIKIRERL